MLLPCRIIIVGGFILVAHSLFAQGTTQFYADMRAVIEVRPGETESTGHALFTLNQNNILAGYADFTMLNFMRGLWMEDGTGTRIAEPFKITSTLPPDAMCPCAGIIAEWEVELTEAQRSQLMAGEFVIRAESTAIPPNYVTGQLALIPEPGVLTILFLGAVFACLPGRRGGG